MKTLKFALIAALVTCTMVSLASADGYKTKPKPIKVVNLTLEEAVHIPGLVVAMYKKLDKDDFPINIQHTYVTEAVYLGSLCTLALILHAVKRFFG